MKTLISATVTELYRCFYPFRICLLLSQECCCRTAQEEYELIADDLRSCAVCKTTLFMSGLQCKHGRLVCLEHADGLCSKCAPSDLTLK